MAILKMEKSTLFSKKRKRQKKVTDAAEKAVKKDIPNDAVFVECFIKTSPTLQWVLQDKGGAVEEDALREEAKILLDALGGSDIVKNPAKQEESKYKTFSFKPGVLPAKIKKTIDDREAIWRVVSKVPKEGYLPNFYQFQRQDLETVLTYYTKQHKSRVHGPGHICRSLILALAMTKFYMRNGQPCYEPGDTTPADVKSGTFYDSVVPKDFLLNNDLDTRDGVYEEIDKIQADYARDKRLPKSQRQRFKTKKKYQNALRIAKDKIAKCETISNAQKDAYKIRAGLGALTAPSEKQIDPATIFFAVAFHDSGRKKDGPDTEEHESARNAFYYMKRLGYSNSYAGNVAKCIVKNEEIQGGAPPRVYVSKKAPDDEGGHRNVLRKDLPPKPAERPLSLNEMIIHDADTLEIHRLLLKRGEDFKDDRFHFLNEKKFDALKKKNFDPNKVRQELIKDAKDLSQLTDLSAAKFSQDQIEERTKFGIVDRFLSFAFSGALEGFLEYERFIIDRIFENPDSFSFLYKYYFESCFDPKCPELNRLSSEQRLALIRGRLHAKEMSSRDEQWAEESFEKFNSQNDPQYDMAKIIEIINQVPKTMNVPYHLWESIIDDFGGAENPTYQQMWQVFYGTDKRRSGASLDFAFRDGVERGYLNFKTKYNHDQFVKSDRPNYSAINGAEINFGAAGKYGCTVVHLKKHIQPRLTYAHNDTFGAGVVADSICSPDNPKALFRQIKPVSGSDPNILRAFAFKHGVDTSEAAGKIYRIANNVNNSFNYLEAHVHGPVSYTQDIEAIIVEITQEATYNLQRAKVKLQDQDIQRIDKKLKKFAKVCKIPLYFVRSGEKELYSSREKAELRTKENIPDIYAPAKQPAQAPARKPAKKKAPEQPASAYKWKCGDCGKKYSDKAKPMGCERCYSYNIQAI